MILKNGDKGSLVSLVQLALERSGYSAGAKDGIFGNKTEAAVKNFQSQNGLVSDGIVGKDTMSALKKYITGYFTYTVKEGDSVYLLARKFYSSVPLIENANPGVSAQNLGVGQRIIIPFNFPLVTTEIPYSSLLTEFICEGLAVRYPFLNLSSVGKSATGKHLLLLTVGRGDKKIFVNASHHANEWITTPLALKYVEDYSISVQNAGYMSGAFAEYLYDKNKLYVMPLVNPDGVDLVTGAFDTASSYYMTAREISRNFPAIPFPSGWKANIKGTDLNLNYPADWERAKELKFAEGFTSPAPRDFVGTSPLSAPESKSVFSLSLKEDFDITLSLHTQGEEIYWQFKNYATDEARRLGEKLAAISGYRLAFPPEFSNYAGYKDWFLQNYRRPGYTVEAGRGQNPLPISDFDRIYPNIKAIISTTLTWDEE